MMSKYLTSFFISKIFLFGLEVSIFCLAFVWLLLGLQTVYISEQVKSRLATVYALMYHHTWYVDQVGQDGSTNPFRFQTVDIVQGKDGLISSKPPIFSLILTGEYLILKKLGYSLKDESHLKKIVQMLIFINIILPFILANLCIWKFLIEINVTLSTRILTLFISLFATQWSAYAIHFSNHVPAGCFLIISLFCLWRYYTASNNSSRIKWLILTGIFSSLVYTFDLPITIFITLGILYVFIKAKSVKDVLWIVIGATPVLCVHFIILYHITGNILPVQISKAPFLYESSYWRHPLGVDALHHSYIQYAFNIILGPKGIFVLYPTLIFCLCFPLSKTWRSVSKDIRTAWFTVLSGFVVLNLYYVFATNNYGGVSYGFRWHIGAMPILVLACVPVFESFRKNLLFWVLCIICLVISLYSCYECRLNPWSIDKEWTTRILFSPLIPDKNIQ